MKQFISGNYYGSSFRSLLWRFGRKLYCYARNDLPQGPENNGEYQLLQIFLKLSQKRVTLVDIGANKGEWTSEALSRAKALGTEIDVHIFEPSDDSCRYLQKLFQSTQVKLNEMAVSDMTGPSHLFLQGPLCGTNSLYPNDGGIRTEIRTISLDDYVDKQGLDWLDFVKSDTEGHDFSVMQGAYHLLSTGKVGIWQFEYNHRWINARNYLRDVFEFMADKPYVIGKLSNQGIEIYPSWNQELERYFESNYVLIHKHYKAIVDIAAVSSFGPFNTPIAINPA
jgi:FkbM family methyltransferase